jgi:hypothetical protein
MMLPAFCSCGFPDRNPCLKRPVLLRELPQVCQSAPLPETVQTAAWLADAAGVGRGTGTGFRPQSGFQSPGKARQAPSVNPSFPRLPRGPDIRAGRLYRDGHRGASARLTTKQSEARR